MTRLIDANKLKMYFDTCQFCEKCPDIAFMCQRSCEFPNILTPQWEIAIDEQPTVDAIPVEFIQKEIEELEESLDFYGSIGEYDALRIDAMYQHDALTGLLRRWKAERKE